MTAPVITLPNGVEVGSTTGTHAVQSRARLLALVRKYAPTDTAREGVKAAPEQVRG